MLEHHQIFQQLKDHAQLFDNLHLRDLFKEDPERFKRFSLESNGLLFDYSKNLITEQTLHLLVKLAKECNLQQQIERLFTGEKINSTEDRSALHTALRNFSSPAIYIDKVNVTQEIQIAFEKMTCIVEKIHNQEWLGFSNKPITDVVNLGIGGSDLGPAMATYALSPYHQNKVQCHFVSNIDDTDIWEATKNLNPETTLFIVASKSFTTQETLSNALSAKNWLLKACPNKEALAAHFIAITACPEKATEWGIDHILPIWDFVGGRFSLWSAIGLPIAIAVGMENFHSLLDGAHAIDEHFRLSPLEKNIPVILALLNIWYVNFFNVRSYAILPYDQYLELLPAYLQQLEMESNGKYRRHNGEKVDYATSPVIWGMVGSNGQHAFHQLLHQGTQLVPIDFILPVTCHHPLEDHHTWLVANCLSQSKALMLGKTEQEVRQELHQQNLSDQEIEKVLPHRVLMGNRPSNTLLIPKLTPFSLGSLIALYEHKVFVQSVIWDINCFDQWGVELGKQLTGEIYQQLSTDNQKPSNDSSTQGLMNYYKKYQQ
ncbi:MAG: glucose-6-phosphate isomerase [Gammaproteobacteria bacterium]|nr:glucose-6-phosphate isomerase [Gammaproteobacteria bacterium]